MFGKKLLYDEPANPMMIRIPDRSPVFVEFRGAIANVDDDSMKVEYIPLDQISVNICRISGFYDHTILVDGRKIRVMETYNEISLRILEAMK